MVHVRPLANGLRTDHPMPGLPFVDDSHIPLEEGAEAIEAVGRKENSGMWGRCDHTGPEGSWIAYTTDPLNHQLGWSVRYHPDHGRTVLLMSARETSSLHSQWGGDKLIIRAGGYWWDGQTWYRPGQVWDPVERANERRKARAAVTITAADMLDGRADPERAYIGKVATFDPKEAAPQTWLDHLALWAERRPNDALPLEQCVVDVASPELTGQQLLGVPEMAELGGIKPSTLRAYISRGNNDVPQPQATVGGRAQWSRAVANDWVEARQRSYEGIKTTMADGDDDGFSPGAAAVRDRFAAIFHGTLWERPDVRKRWALRARNDASVREISDDLAWDVAANLDRIIPPDILGPALDGALLNDFAELIEMERKRAPQEQPETWHLSLTIPVAKMLDWFIRHHPEDAHSCIGRVMYEARKRWQIPPKDTLRTLRQALSLDGELTKQQRETYFALLSPRKDID